VNERLEKISRLLTSQKSRAGYIKAKLSVLVPAQIRLLRLKSMNPPMPYQRDLARQTELHQSRISMFETPGMSNMTLETLSKVAAGLGVGVKVKFVSFSDMLRWENSFSSDFNVLRIEEDREFIEPNSGRQSSRDNSIGIQTSIDDEHRAESSEVIPIEPHEIAASAKKPQGRENDFAMMAASGEGGR
jgi:transcriptional regulator with XRE-family HTH domain